ncbi:MAG: hypothetical protein KKD28_10210 [Chloroflexi bacterium]|nr:hypothetical protein [Chloroflexota bacterium]MBU1661832.1 hypothetical protein [Chloroflexota bacterium]
MTEDYGDFGETVTPDEYKAPGEKKDNKTVIIVVVAIVLCCCCAVSAAGAWYLYNNGDNLFGLAAQISNLAFIL